MSCLIPLLSVNRTSTWLCFHWVPSYYVFLSHLANFCSLLCSCMSACLSNLPTDKEPAIGSKRKANNNYFALKLLIYLLDVIPFILASIGSTCSSLTERYRPGNPSPASSSWTVCFFASVASMLPSRDRFSENTVDVKCQIAVRLS